MPAGIGLTTTWYSAKRRCATVANDTIVSFSDPAFRDELSDLVREGARRIIDYGDAFPVDTARNYGSGWPLLGYHGWNPGTG